MSHYTIMDAWSTSVEYRGSRAEHYAEWPLGALVFANNVEQIFMYILKGSDSGLSHWG
jgi:hypothetical protein